MAGFTGNGFPVTASSTLAPVDRFHKRPPRVTRDPPAFPASIAPRKPAGWDEVVDVLAVRTRANAVLARHPLRAADAGQLGAALLVSEQLADPLVFLCLDQRLVEAAEREGLAVADTAIEGWRPGD